MELLSSADQLLRRGRLARVFVAGSFFHLSPRPQAARLPHSENSAWQVEFDAPRPPEVTVLTAKSRLFGLI